MGLKYPNLHLGTQKLGCVIMILKYHYNDLVIKNDNQQTLGLQNLCYFNYRVV